MTWLAPWALFGGALGMLGIVAAHLLSRQRPRALALATARFLPSGMLEATTVQRVPQDRWWMLLRLLIVALLAAGAAQPVLTGRKVPTRTVLLLDRTLPVDVQRETLASLTPDDVVIAYDTTAQLQAVASLVPARASRASQASQASLSASLAALAGVRDSLGLRAQEVRIAVASRFAPTSIDPATARLRALVRDSITIRMVSAPVDSAVARGAIVMRAEGDDPVAATALLLGDSVARAGTVIERHEALTPDDQSAAERGATIVHWPARVASGVSNLGAISVAGVTWIAPLQRDSAAASVGARAIGWWADGSPAVWRRDSGTGCVLTVHAAIPEAGDHALSLAAQAWLRALVNECNRESTGVSAAPSWLAPAPSAKGADVARQTLVSALSPWLVVAALVLAAVELALRAMSRRS